MILVEINAIDFDSDRLWENSFVIVCVGATASKLLVDIFRID